MSDAISAFGTLLKIGDGGATETFATVAEVKKLGGPKLKLDIEDVTNHSSEDAWREKIGTLLDGGDVDVGVSWVPTHATHSAATGILADMVARAKRNYQMVFPDTAATTWHFTALVTVFEPAEDPDGVLDATVKLTITGKPTLA